MKTRTALTFLVVLAATIGLGLAAETDLTMQMGTWKLNEGKSKFAPGATKNTTVVYSAAGDQIKCVTDGVDKDGKPVHTEWTGKFDGKDYPVTGGAPGTTISIKRPDPKDAHTVDWVWKVPGKYTSTGRTVYSKDGKTRVIDDKVVDTSGKTTTRHRFYERQ